MIQLVHFIPVSYRVMMTKFLAQYSTFGALLHDSCLRFVTETTCFLERCAVCSKNHCSSTRSCACIPI